MDVYRGDASQCGAAPSLLSAPRQDAFASVVVFLVALPLCMGIAIASGVPVAAGLVTGIVGGIVVGFFAGAPLQVSGPAAGLTVLMYEFVQSFGWESLGIAVLIAGCFQLMAGLLRLGQGFRAVSPAVVQGMLAGIGVLILCSQVHVMVDDAPRKSGLANIATIPEAFKKGLTIPDWQNADQRRVRLQLLNQARALHTDVTRMASSLNDQSSTTSSAGGGVEPEMLLRQQNIAGQIDLMAEALSRESASGLDGQKDLHNLTAQARQQIGSSIQNLQTGDVLAARQSSLSAGESLHELQTALKDHSWAAKVGLLTMAILLAWSRFAPERLKKIPAPLVAIVSVAAVSSLLQLPVLSVNVPDNLWNEMRFPTLTRWQRVPTAELLRFGLVIAIVASAQTLFCATAVDQLQKGSRTDYDRELTAHGIGNILCGALGALPMAGVIVRSAANIDAGAKTRLSTILHGTWLLIFVSSLAFLLRMIPTAALAAMLVYMGYRLVNPQAVRQLLKYGRGEVLVYAVTLVTIVTTDMLTGVAAGFAVSALRLMYRFSRLDVSLETRASDSRTVLKIAGAATFLRLPRLAARLEQIPGDSEVHVDFQHLSHIDHACLDLLLNWAKRHEGYGGRLVIDWDSLHATFHGQPSHRPAFSLPQRHAA